MTHEEVDPWLSPGCHCLVTCCEHIDFRLMFFTGSYTVEGFPIFAEKICNGKTTGKSFITDRYKPIGTPWDFAPKDAEFIFIYDNGCFEFGDKNEQIISRSLNIIWNTCKEDLKNKILPRPEWAKE